MDYDYDDDDVRRSRRRRLMRSITVTHPFLSTLAVLSFALPYFRILWLFRL